jgi:hypothetical protein
MIKKIEEFLNSLGYTLRETFEDKGDGYKYEKREPDGNHLVISIFMGNKGRQTISKRDINSYKYNNYVEFSPLELKFFDALNFETSYWHDNFTNQTAQDWLDAGEVELNF